MISLATLHFAQSGECFYCGEWAWLENHQPHAEIKAKLGLPRDVSRKIFDRRKATREHLKRRADGGSNLPENLIMACQFCNMTRGDTPVLIHLANMRAAAALRWAARCV